MAIVTYGGGVTEFRGAIGGLVFSRNKSATYVRERAKPVNTRSDAQQQHAQRLAAYSDAWTIELTQGERDAWIAKAAATVWVNRLGENYNPSGINLYVRAQTLKAIAHGSRWDPAPAVVDEGPYVFTMAFVEGVGIRITGVGGLSNVPAGTLLTWYSRDQSLGRSTFQGPFTFLSRYAITADPPPFTWIACADLVRERRYFFRFRVIRNGNTVGLPNFNDVAVPVAP